MRKLQALGLLLAVGTLPIGCAVYSSASYSPWEGQSVMTGSGGTKKIVDGMEIWQVGTPPCPFQVLGLISQRNLSDGSALSVIANVNSESELVKQARLHGGDAILLLSENSRVVGSNGTYRGNGYGGTYSSTTATSSQTGVAVIKYLPMVAPAPAPVAESYMPSQTPVQATP